MIDSADEKELGNHMRQLDELLQEVESISDPKQRERTGRIIQSLMDFHGAAITRLLERLADRGDEGIRLIDEIASDNLIGSLLVVYGLHPLDLESRVRLALENVRPYLASHGGNVELLSVSESGIVRLRMQGSCHGCPSSAITLKSSIEQAIYEKAPEVTAIETEDGHAQESHAPQEKSVFVPIERLIKPPKLHLQGTMT